MSSKLVCSAWSGLGHLLPDEVSRFVFNRIIEHYVNIRAKAFVVAWLQVLKCKARQDISRKGEKGLRKGLKKKKESKIPNK
jgi:hypothetical protein